MIVQRRSPETRVIKLSRDATLDFSTQPTSNIRFQQSIPRDFAAAHNDLGSSARYCSTRFHHLCQHPAQQRLVEKGGQRLRELEHLGYEPAHF